MMDPQVARLIELWQQSLEEGLAPARQMELDDLIDKPDLAQGLVDWQAERSPLEDPGSADYSAMDHRVIRRLRNQALWQKYKTWAFGLGLGALVLVGYWLGRPGDEPLKIEQSHAQLKLVDGTQRAALPVPKAAYDEEEDEGPRIRPTMAPPPGFGERPRKITRRSVERLRVDWALAGDSRAEVLVLNASGRPVRLVWRGQAAAGPHASYWDGSLDGQPAQPGRYRLVVRSAGREIAKQETEILAP